VSNLKELLIINRSVFIVEKSKSKDVIMNELLKNKDYLRLLLVRFDAYDEDKDNIFFQSFFKVFLTFLLE
jgi:hypothetical protein